MKKDRWIFLIVGAVICALLIMSLLPLFKGLFKTTEVLVVRTTDWKETVVYSDTTFYILPETGEPVPIDTSTRLLDMPVRLYRQKFSPDIMVNKQIISPPMTVEAEVQGRLFSLSLETQEGWEKNLGEQRCKFDLKWPLLAFILGAVVMKVID